ncbi:hypothetical protein [Geobacter sp. SVR]|uniref:hypothetical protein n=1 Tax=Geobacter sp. SVR TaxID=2495594 RepID=UPI00143EFFED|nr:hypothetical protein [Geobacter sp. SVR]BCS55617.1 hypothetical protein GSVR_39250 [Geobacter sp. SVR]GCF83620.1 hypothetical protein GSbR_02200 [Geobacter sp. SVR]
MIPSSLKFHWMAPEPTASALAKKIISINKHAWDLLARLNEDQVFDLIIMIEERIDFFSSLVNIKPEYGKDSSLDIFKGIYNSMRLFSDESSFESYIVPEDLDVLQVFAAFAASKASYAFEFLAGRNITTAHLEKFGSVEVAATALASDATIEAAESLVVGYAEFKRTHEFFTAEEHEERRRENLQVRATKGGAGNSSKYQPLREKAFQLYDRLVSRSEVQVGYFTAAGLIHSELFNFGVEIGLIKKAEKTEEDRMKSDTLTQETIYRWLRKRDLQNFLGRVNGPEAELL